MFIKNDTFVAIINLQVALVHGGVGACGDRRYPGIYVRIDSPEIYDFIAGILNK